MFVEADGNSLQYVSYGEGPPVLFIHGLGGSANVWHGVMQAMQQHHHVIALDLRGHGRSQGRGKFSIDLWVKDVQKLLGVLELSAVSVVGHSLGSLVAQQLAVKAPELVDSLVLVGGISYFSPETTKAYEERANLVEKDGLDRIIDGWLQGAISPQSHANQSGMAGLLRELILRNDPQNYAKACRALASVPQIRRDEIGQPTLVVTGAHDRSTPLGMAEELQKAIPVCRVKVLSDVGHWAPLEAPGPLAATMLEFLT